MRRDIVFTVYKNRDLRATTKLFLLCLINHSNGAGQCTLNYFDLAELCGVDRRTAERAIKKLIDAGYISKHTRAGRVEHLSNSLC